MAKKNIFTEEQIAFISQIAAQAAIEAVKVAMAEAKLQEEIKSAQTRTSPKSQKKPQSKKTSSSETDWEEKKAELAALSESFAFTKAMDNFIKANPSCSKKEFDAKFGRKGMTREMLAARKKELKVR